ncbi:MAG: hypothetical protein JXA54_07305 [Candidatus Heimdallarchaeota archaeon]|nr:hypothetical protein [Candidatus Heimdallarchaeota archaeon]
MVSQIIISNENSTSFFSIGSVQDDATLVSALGGALASFAIEMGLSDTGTTQANYSKFQNGILISKWLEIGNYKPSIMIAVRGFDNLQSYQQVFLIDYGTLLTQKILSVYEKLYASYGPIPNFTEAVKLLPEVVNSLYKDSPNTLKEFTQAVDKNCLEFLDEIWENQGDRSLQQFSFRTVQYHPSKIAEIHEEFVNYFYREGVAKDALFPLKFASSPDLSGVRRYLSDYLKKKANDSRNELVEEIVKISKQLYNMSSSRSKRGKQTVESVDFINANMLFEQISVAKLADLDKTRVKILDNVFTTLLQKLYQKYPLKFISAASTSPIDIQFISNNFEKTVQTLLETSLKESPHYSKQMAEILRDVANEFTPDEAIKKSSEIISQVEMKFIERIIKDDPFIIIADFELRSLRKIASQLAKESFKHYRTAHDEAMALWYIIRQIYETHVKLKTTSLTTLMKIYLLQNLIRKYQFRSVPLIIYDLTKGVLSDIIDSTSSIEPLISLLQRNQKAFEKESGILIPNEITNVIFKRIKIIKAAQSFEKIEALSYFSKAFSSALESTIVKILEIFFGTKKYPQPPKLLSEAIEKIISTSQSIYSTCRIIHSLARQPAAKDLFKKDVESVFVSTLKFSSIIPTPIELSRLALEKGWMIEIKKSSTPPTKSTTKAQNLLALKKELEKVSDNQLLIKNIEIPALEQTGSLSSLITEPIIIVKLLEMFLEPALLNRYDQASLELKEFEKKAKTTAGNISGKKKLADNIKLMKFITKNLKQLISGGSAIQKLFTGKKDLKKLIQLAAKEKYPELNYYTRNFRANGEDLSVKIDPMFGNYEQIIEVFASTWVRDSEYIGKLKEDILWRIIENDSKNIPLERRVIKDLQQAAIKGKKQNQEIIVRNSIEQEVSLLFNKAVRDSIATAFDSIKDDLVVRVDSASKENYIVIDTIDVAKKYLQPIFDKMKYAKSAQKADNKTEIWLSIGELLPTIITRKKKAQSIRSYLRDGLKENLRLYHLKALNSLGDLIDLYIGEQATDLFYTKSRILEQLILESIDQS